MCGSSRGGWLSQHRGTPISNSCNRELHTMTQLYVNVTDFRLQNADDLQSDDVLLSHLV